MSWNLFFALFFVGLSFIGLYILEVTGGVPQWISLFDLLLVCLATFRLTRLIAYDAITDFFRAWFQKFPKESFFGTMGVLVNCPWCLALWFSLFVVFFYYLTPVAWFFILFLAVAGVASVFQIISNLLGWHAESKKRDVLLAEEDLKNNPSTEKKYRIVASSSRCG